MTILPQLKEFWKRHTQQPVVEEPAAAMKPNVQLFRAQMETLSPFADMSTEERLRVSVSISVPAWLTGTDEVCEAVEAAQLTFGRVFGVENTPSASYTATGYELCPITYDAFNCTGPGRIMTIDLGMI